MIIYPQINNLKIVIVPSIVVFIILGIYSYKSYNSLREFNTYLVEEKNEVATELFDMILEYHDIEIDNDSLKSQLEASRLKINNVLDSVQNLKPNVYLVANYKKQLRVLKNENRHILKLVEKLNQENELLKIETNNYATELEESKSKVSKFKVSKTKLSSVNSNLNKTNEGLSEKIEFASKITPKITILQKTNEGLSEKVEFVSKIIPKITLIQAVKREKSDRSLIITKSAKRTKKLNISIKIPENKLAKKGKRLYYLQIIDPNSNVVGDRGLVSISNDETLINSKEIIVDYQNKEISLNYFIEQKANEPFFEGVYHVGLYNSKELIEKTIFTLH